MCGITGYVGSKNAVPILLEGLLKLEYRGYDSAGIALLKNGILRVCKKKGRVGTLAEEVRKMNFSANTGISHTRWATHGGVTDANAHPHVSSDGNFALVHNGIIENYESIKNFLSTKGYTFSSQTDSEVLVNLIAYHYSQRTDENTENRFMEAVRKALLHVEGTYGIAVLCRFNDGEIVAARKGSPLLIGVGKNERLVSSDVLGFAGRASNVIYLEDNQIALVTADSCDIVTTCNKPINYTVSEIDWNLESADLGNCKHYMQKEIMEQPAVLENAIRGRISDDGSTAVLNGLNMTPADMRQIDRILFCACGTAWHACLVAEYLIEKYARIPVEVEYASEFRYRNAPLDKNTLVFVISQSGETIDTLQALRESKRKGFKTLAITNSVGSTISRESDGGLYQYAGKEVGVASTKAFTSQIAICLLIALYIGRMRDLSFYEGRLIVDAIKSLPSLAAKVLKLAPAIEKIARKYAHFSDFLFIGRLSEFPVALEGALKLKEISYIHAEGYPAAEMKHGPIALVSPECPTVVLATSDEILPKVVSNAQEIKARKGPIIAITNRPEAFEGIADDIIPIPQAHDCVKAIIATIPIQLLAYYIAVQRGCDVDKPRNLAKAVTVE
ncbi:MAG TPA: glutamine--fructose-6-phosphate transaminase (isomerizing) [Candidatus Merdousia gallistercoris]|nr:glutamine--fructose-6-phosphate transaminase (isomerizing) [Candidatus Merdousia gallistercoris]